MDQVKLTFKNDNWRHAKPKTK